MTWLLVVCLVWTAAMIYEAGPMSIAVLVAGWCSAYVFILVVNEQEGKK